METVAGIGGVFFRAKDLGSLAKWYAEHLGILEVLTDYENPVWQQAAGPTVFAPFPNDTDYFGDPGNKWMINFRVSDLDAMVEQPRSAGIEVEVNPEAAPNGLFARLSDPEGNPIELWELA